MATPLTALPTLVLKLLKMATGMRALLDTVVQALPQVGDSQIGFGVTVCYYNKGILCREGGAHREREG